MFNILFGDKFRHDMTTYTSAPLAKLMASMMNYSQEKIHILDPGAGVGSLFSACVEEACRSKRPPRDVKVTAYEIDSTLADDLERSLENVQRFCDKRGVLFSGKVVKGDIISDYASGDAPQGFTHAITNSPYSKIKSYSETHKNLHRVGLQATNTYAAFVAISQHLLNDDGQMVFISPRSFCNGSYFGRFRENFLKSMSLRRIHLFKSRTSSFQDDGVLQENVIICAKKGGRRGPVTISASGGPKTPVKKRMVRYSDVVFDGDPQRFIHIIHDSDGARVSKIMRTLECTLSDLGIDVSTGKVIDFYIRDELRYNCTDDSAVPLVRTFNISDSKVSFPSDHHKHHNFIVDNSRSKKLLVVNGNYVLVKRFTAPKEKRRIVAAVWNPREYDTSLVAFENRINYFHADGGGGIDPLLANGLWAFLNSSWVDTYFKQFNGSTQVNATDLRYLRYPSEKILKILGMYVGLCNQKRIDEVVEELI